MASHHEMLFLFQLFLLRHRHLCWLPVPLLLPLEPQSCPLVLALWQVQVEHPLTMQVVKTVLEQLELCPPWVVTSF